MQQHRRGARAHTLTRCDLGPAAAQPQVILTLPRLYRLNLPAGVREAAYELSDFSGEATS